jgi:CRISPR/Cas system-associated endonuclease Cas3-HD
MEKLPSDPIEQSETIETPEIYSFDELAKKIPELKAMYDFDQKSDYHTLTLADHTKELVKTLEEDSFLKDHPQRKLVILAGILHDLGKMSPEGSQIHPKDPEKRHYVGHEKESEKIAEKVLEQHFSELSDEEKKFVSVLTGLHASALSLMDSFKSANYEPKGKKLKSFEKFLEKINSLPLEMSNLDKMRIIFAINRADKKAGYNENSDLRDEKVFSVIQKSDTQLSILRQLENAMPAILEAIENRKNGNQNAGIQSLEDGTYVCI